MSQRHKRENVVIQKVKMMQPGLDVAIIVSAYQS